MDFITPLYLVLQIIFIFLILIIISFISAFIVMYFLYEPIMDYWMDFSTRVFRFFVFGIIISIIMYIAAFIDINMVN
jgi:hypothetical protein